MARYDKYDPKSGGFRAPLAFATVAADVGTIIGVGLDANGRVVRGGGNTGVLGVICPTQARPVGAIEDVMTSGEIVDVDGLAAGTVIGSDAAGAIAAAAAGATRIGHTVEATRLVVRVRP